MPHPIGTVVGRRWTFGDSGMRLGGWKDGGHAGFGSTGLVGGQRVIRPRGWRRGERLLGTRVVKL